MKFKLLIALALPIFICSCFDNTPEIIRQREKLAANFSQAYKTCEVNGGLKELISNRYTMAFKCVNGFTFQVNRD